MSGPKGNRLAHCLSCGAKLHDYTAVERNTVAKENDISVCAYCGHIAIFRADLTLREMTAAERPAVLRRIAKAFEQ